MIEIREIEEAMQRVRADILRTPLIRSPWLSEHTGGEVYLKLENEQHTGSFKARGSLNKLRWMQQKGINSLPVTASTGNHGLGFARALDLLGMQGKIFLPTTAVSSKVDAIRTYDVELEFHGDDPYDTEMHARNVSEEKGWTYVSPYNDREIIAGQATIGWEIADQLDHADRLLATVGGGGLISGVATYLRHCWPAIEIIGCQPENSPEMARSVEAGSYQEVESKPTLSDGSAGGFERNAMTFYLCTELVDRFQLVNEEEIAAAIRETMRHHQKVIEGSAGVAVASILQDPESFRGKTSVIVICGANIPLEKLQDVLCQAD